MPAAMEGPSSYLTVSPGGEGRAEFTERRSRFIGFAAHADDEAAARAYVKAIAARYHDARHVCWAFRTGPAGERSLSSDNGEPSGTAGRPILQRIAAAGLDDTVVAVVRYFGGVKLGPSGLIAAYRQAAADALEAAPKQHMTRRCRVEAIVSWDRLDALMRLVKTTPGVDIVERRDDALCTLILAAPLDLEPTLRARLASLAL